MLLFRSLETQQIFGGIVLSGVPPCIVPPAKTGGDISSDYVFHLCDHLERKLGGTFLFARSPGAGLIPFIDAFSHPSAHRYGISVGSGLAQDVKEARWEKLKKARFYYREGLALPLKEEAALPDSELAARVEKYRAQSLSIRGANLDLSTKRGIQDQYLSPHYLRAHFSRFGRPREIAVKALRLNRFFFVSLPGEHFLKTSAALKSAVPGTELCVADHADEYIACLVPEEEWQGGFEPNRSLFKPQAWQKLMDGAAGLVRAARSGEDAQVRP
jgi:hypothetical protein